MCLRYLYIGVIAFFIYTSAMCFGQDYYEKGEYRLLRSDYSEGFVGGMKMDILSESLVKGYITLQRHIDNFIVALRHLICYISRNILKGGRLCYQRVGQRAMYFLFQSFPL